MNILHKNFPLTKDSLDKTIDLWKDLFPKRKYYIIVGAALRKSAKELNIEYEVNHFIGTELWFLTDVILEDGLNNEEVLDWKKRHEEYNKFKRELEGVK